MLIPTFLGVTLLTFALIRLIPGDPVEVMMGERPLDPEMHAAGHAAPGSRPTAVCAIRSTTCRQTGAGQIWASRCKTQASVWNEFKSRCSRPRWNWQLVALLFALVLGLIAGVLAAVKRGTCSTTG